jgi:hypothetical protein
MTSDDEPRRWVEGGADPLLARLSRAGRSDGPSPRALRAAPVAVAALLLSSAPLAATAAEVSGAASALSAKSALSPLLLLKWVAIGALGSGSLLALGHAPELLRSAPSVQTAHAPRAQPRPATVLPAAPSAERPPAAQPEPESGPAPELPSARPSDVAREVKLLDAARAALVAGDTAKALRLLHTLERVPARALVPEATVLRVRALLADGRRAEAQRVTEQFSARAPSAPQANVLRQLIANSEIRAPR